MSPPKNPFLAKASASIIFDAGDIDYLVLNPSEAKLRAELQGQVQLRQETKSGETGT